MSAIIDAIVDAAHGHMPPGFAEALAPIVGELDDRLHAVEAYIEREAARGSGVSEPAPDVEAPAKSPVRKGGK